METIIEGKKIKVTISPESPTVLIGERINPTGKAKLAEALERKDLDYVVKEALRQVEAGAHVIDLNVGAAGLSEEELLPMVVKEVSDAVDVPVCIDSSNPKAMQKALEAARGRPLLNSTTGEQKSLEKILPLAAKYNVPVIGLAMDEEGIPNEPGRRLQIAEKILQKAAAFGIKEEDILIDVVVMPVGADTDAAKVTFEAARQVSAKLGLNLVAGASNVSHGLPERRILNAGFMAIGAASGITAYLADPTAADTVQIILAADLLLGKDEWAANYIAYCRKRGG